jgi:mannose-6-phosphate isomerase-like protein (cupin superfamily)
VKTHLDVKYGPLEVVDVAGRTFALEPRQGLTVPRGLEHRTRAPERTVILIVENAEIIPTGDERKDIPE